MALFFIEEFFAELKDGTLENKQTICSVQYHKLKEIRCYFENIWFLFVLLAYKIEVGGGFMHSDYQNRFQKTNDFLFSPQLQPIATLNNPHSFTRKRKMPLADLILPILSKKRSHYYHGISSIF